MSDNYNHLLEIRTFSVIMHGNDVCLHRFGHGIPLLGGVGILMSSSIRKTALLLILFLNFAQFYMLLQTCGGSANSAQ
jgi:hypothetical protein